MLKTLGIVEACFQTDQLRARASRKLGGKPVLEWAVRRATDCQQLDGVIVVTSDEAENQSVSDLVPLDVPIFTSTQPDSLACLSAALEEYACESAVRIGATYPFVDPVLIDLD